MPRRLQRQFMRKRMMTIGFSSHRVEALSFARSEMEKHQIIILEEPPNTHFYDMLDGRLAIHEYLMEIDSAFPEFDRRMCNILGEFHGKGWKIMQVEPYLEKLLNIHDLFAEGRPPEYVLNISGLKEVYKAEKRATGALIVYYSSSVRGNFDRVIDSVKNFARLDAERLTLRARLRATAIAAFVSGDKDIYIESGYIHYPLYFYLRRKLASTHNIRPVFLLQPIVKSLKGRRRNMGPGDLLTLHYSFDSIMKKDLADLLAARSLVYIKLIQKEEMLPGQSDAPHTHEEVKINRLVDKLEFEDCRKIFEKIRLENRERALQVVKDYIDKKETGGN